ncbi:hypothetical protein [Rosistilla oblonga]|uniref:Uncharacterized protein n=1 Tax=Rosistilla oblonga TaxID=2527990 RepID=A0A518IW70_9BACT|nr:hypothetical protein [Rosistilla oblonga]QDV57342.1 hypothetical protein Mal33_33460 [Rosistilla oblonga]
MRNQIPTIAALLAVYVAPQFCLSKVAAADPVNRVEAVGLFEVAAIDLVPANADEPGKSLQSGGSAAAGTVDRDPIADRLASLMKPLGQIRLEPADDGTKAPENRAAAQLPAGETVITAEFGPLSPPNRYPICSCHNPLYFEEPDLERCGNGCGIATTAVSAVHFFANTLTLPYQIAADPPCTTQCAAGDCRCCEEMPRMRPFECKLHAATLQGLATAGFVFLLL